MTYVKQLTTVKQMNPQTKISNEKHILNFKFKSIFVSTFIYRDADK